MVKSDRGHVPPFGFYSMARSNLQGALRIATTMNPAQRDRDTCIQFLLGFVAEGYFKAFLAHGGMSEEGLRKIGHNLIKARDEAMAHGLPIGELHQLRFVVETLQAGHKQFHYRYLPDNLDGSEKQFALVLPMLAFDALKLLDQAVFPFLRPEINRELTRQGREELQAWPGVDGMV